MMRRLPKLFASFAAIGLLSVVFLELLVRVFSPQQEPSLWLKPDPRYGHLMKPHFHQAVPFPGSDFVMQVQTNSLGFRDEEPLPKEEGLTTVVFAGDSFTFGHGIAMEDRFDEVAEDLLAEKGKRIRAINVGVSAWGTIQQTRYLLDHVDELQPDIVVLTFCENDPQDDEYFLATGISFDRVRFPGKDFLRAHSHLFRWLQQLYLVMRKTRVAPVAQTAPQPAPPPTATPGTAYAITDLQWQHTSKILREFMQQWRRKNPQARLLVQCTIPWEPAINGTLKGIVGGIDGAEFIDLSFRAAELDASNRRLPYDGHWSPAMHRNSAEALAEALP